MSKMLIEIAQQLRDANKKVQLIYAFNSTGKTRLSREFKQLIALSNKTVTEPTPQEKQTVKILLNNLINNYGYWQQEQKNG